MNKSNFVDAQARHAQHSEFEVPSRAELAALAAGHFVKVIAPVAGVMNMSGERFWIELTGVNGHRLTGKVNNHLLYTYSHGWKLDDVAEFSTDHVLSIELPRGADHV